MWLKCKSARIAAMVVFAAIYLFTAGLCMNLFYSDFTDSASMAGVSDPAFYKSNQANVLAVFGGIAWPIALPLWLGHEAAGGSEE